MMTFNREEHVAFLDEVRRKRGHASLIKTFQHTRQRNEIQAAEYLNDDHLCFPTLYVLSEEIAHAQLYDQLCDRCRGAIDFLQQKTPEVKGDAQAVHASLKWMVETGGCENVDQRYAQTLDAAVAMLIFVYGNRSALSAIVRMIVHRYRNGLPYHYLVTSLFETRNPYHLAMVGEYLRSDDETERECARRLLAFVPGVEGDDSDYHRFCRWLEDNGPFLRYKGETFDTTHRPTPYHTVLWAKYLGTFIDANSGNAFVSLSKREHRLVRKFHDLPKETREFLADESARKRQRHAGEWAEWINLPLKKQLKTVEGGADHDSYFRL